MRVPANEMEDEDFGFASKRADSKETMKSDKDSCPPIVGDNCSGEKVFYLKFKKKKKKKLKV